MKKKFLKMIATVLTLGMLLTACSSNTGEQANNSSSTEENIVIGGLAPLTGNVAIYGETAVNGAKLAFEEINEAGGILGKEVIYEVYDEKGDPTEAVNAYNKLSEKGVAAILGDITSKPTAAVASIAESEGMPMVTPTGTQLDITKDKDGVFRVCFTDPFQGEMLAKYAGENLKAKTAALMKNNSSDYSDGVYEAFKEKAKDYGIEIVAEESYGDTDKDFRAQLTNIAKKSPDVLIIPDYYQVLSLIVTQAREAGIEATFLGPDGWDGVIKQLDKSSYDALEGAIFSNHYSIKDEDPKVKNFVEKYKEKYNDEPSAFAALSYDGAYMLKEAIEKAGSTDHEAIIKELKNIEFSGVTGNLKFDENNNPVKAISMIKIVDGDYTFDTLVEPK